MASRGARSTWIALAAAPFALAAVLGSLGVRHWFCDLCAHASVQCAGALVAAAALLVLARRHWLALALLPGLLPALWRSSELWRPAAAQLQALDDAPVLRLATVNVLVDNLDAKAVLAALRSEPFDAIACSELDERWLRDLAPLREQFPHFVGRPDGIFGLGLFSRHPLRNAQVVPLGFDWAPAITAELLAPQGSVSLLVVHPPRPSLWGQDWTDHRDRALAAVPALLRSLPAPRILLGDCNATRWSAAFRALQRESGLVDSADGRGFQPSWPTLLPPFLRIPIDQVLVDPGIAVRRRWLGPHVGSDHLPVFVELALPRR